MDATIEATVPPGLQLELVQQRALTAFAAQDFPAADRVFTDVLNRDPTNRTALFNRARARHKLGRFREAATDARKLVTLEPRFAKAWFVYGAALLMFHHDVDALAALEKSIDLDPLDPEAHHTYAGALHMLNRDEEAIREWSLAHQMDPSRAETAVGQAMTLLRQDAGRSQQGWQTFESRRATGITDLYPGIPLWLNKPSQPIDQATIIVRSEQGFGDTIQFVRYLQPLQAAGAVVTLECPYALTRLFQRCFPGVEIVPPGGQALNGRDFDWQTSLMSLPLAFPDLPSVERPYLWADRVQQGTGLFRPPATGLVWHGGPRPDDHDAHSIDERRSLPPAIADHFQFRLENVVKVISLQQADLPPGVDFDYTASVIDRLDRVIAVDTAVAHLAAAMGKPVWLLNRLSSCWRWGNHGETSHWYPTMRIFRQPTPGDWGTVCNRVIQALEAER
jgi:cytochrome c-type biogenesis protein CcmH/NrfG